MVMLGLRPKPKSTNQAPAPNSTMNRRKTTVPRRMESLPSLFLLGSGETQPHHHMPPQGSASRHVRRIREEATCKMRNNGRYQTQYRRPPYRCQFCRYTPKPLVIRTEGILLRRYQSLPRWREGPGRWGLYQRIRARLMCAGAMGFLASMPHLMQDVRAGTAATYRAEGFPTHGASRVL